MATKRIRGGEAGMISAASAVFLLALVTLAALVAQLLALAAQQMHLQNSAELAAISAAVQLRETGSQDLACRKAAEVSHGALSCYVQGEIVEVSLSEPGRWWIANLQATARAGPAGAILP